MPEDEESFLRMVYRRVGASTVGAPRKPSMKREGEGEFFHTESPQPVTDPDEIDYLNLVLGGNKIKMDLEGFKGGRKRIRQALDFDEKKFKEEKRRYALQEALDHFNEKEFDEPREKWKLGEKLGQLLMDFHGLEKRHIGSEVSVKIPYRDKYGNVEHEEEFGSRDLFMYGKDKEGDRKGISIEVEKELDADSAHKFLYGLTSDFIVDGEDVSLSHNIILTKELGSDLRKYLQVESKWENIYTEKKDEEGNVKSLKVKPSKEEMKDISEEELKRMVRSLDSRPFKESTKRLWSPEEQPKDVVLESIIEQKSNDLEKGLKRTAIGITNPDGEKIRQFILFEENGNEIKPLVIDRDEAKDVLTKEKHEETAEKIEKEYEEEV